ncbi:hypothetical protein BH23ACT9_BH23ACT9_28550 [soil metagenome]
MTRIDCPALRNDDTLGFLAALGLLELAVTALDLPDTRLGWTGMGGHAQLDIDCTDVDDLTDRLADVAGVMHARGRVLPFDHEGVVDPPASDAERNLRAEELGRPVRLDPVRVDAQGAADLYRKAAVRERDGDLEPARWVLALVNHFVDAKGEDKHPTRALAPLYAPAGRMTVHQLFRDALAEVHKRPSLLGEALLWWGRESGTGANLDDRALRDAAVTAEGGAGNRAVPGATWLGLMALPLFRQTGTPPSRAGAVGWDTSQRGRSALRWPTWRAPLDRPSIEVLLAHPAVTTAARPPRAAQPSAAARRHRDAMRTLRALGIDAVCLAGRRPLEKSAGALRPPQIIPVP